VARSLPAEPAHVCKLEVTVALRDGSRMQGEKNESQGGKDVDLTFWIWRGKNFFFSREARIEESFGLPHKL
jgi:hypothetical protein